MTFASHEVTITGTGLHRIEVALQRMQLSYISAVQSRFLPVVANEQPVIRKIAVTVMENTDCPNVAK
ncbi:MAG: hypothetical protein J0M24_03470 [Verrucomicrobia bacterium]|nr:hypothetical protein [Verrucomicrobiota bacterium]